MNSFVDYWQIKERPFEPTWDSRFFYGSPAHLEALNSLSYMAMERSFHGCVMTGSIGAGKTLTREVFARQLDRRYFNVITLENGGFTYDELLELLIRTLNPSGEVIPTGRHACSLHLGRLLQEYARMDRHTLVVLDEAQDIPAQTLHDLRYLTNFNRDGRTALSLMLIGQPELHNAIALDAALQQRINLRLYLTPLSANEVSAYIAHRLRVAGHADGICFEPGTAEVLHTVSHGIPREINRFAKLAMEHAWFEQKTKVDYATVEAVIKHSLRYQKATATAAA